MTRLYTHYRVADGSNGEVQICEAPGCGQRVLRSEMAEHDLMHPERAAGSVR